MDTFPKAAADQALMRQVLARQRPDRLPCSTWYTVEYRPEVYHLGEMDHLPQSGEVAVSADGKRRFTRDGGVWAVGDRERYRTGEDVLAVAPEDFEVECVGPPMLDAMTAMADAAAQVSFVWPWHYGTLVTRATIEFGWEPFLVAAALEPERFGRLLDRFGEASLAVVRGWAQTPGVELVIVHDDIAATRGPILSPDWLRRHAFPWYERLFAAIHEAGRQVLYISDGNTLPVLADLLATGPDGLFIESSSMDPAEFMARGGPDKLYLIKTDNRAVDLGTPEQVRDELRKLRDLHQDYPGMMIYRGGGAPTPEQAAAFDRAYLELLVYA
jgi:hypothetical protein